MASSRTADVRPVCACLQNLEVGRTDTSSGAEGVIVAGVLRKQLVKLVQVDPVQFARGAEKPQHFIEGLVALGSVEHPLGGHGFAAGRQSSPSATRPSMK